MAITKTLTTDEAGRKPKLTAEEIILEQRRQTADYIIKQIEEQEKLPPWERGFVFDIKGQYNPISNVQYSGANIMHLTAAALKNGWQDPRWITIPQMKAENERLEGNGFPRAYKLRKGSKSTILEFHQEVYRDETTGKIMPTNRTSDNTSSSDKRDDERNTWWVHKYYKVFNAEQFELFPELEQTQEVIKEFPEEVRNKFIENIIQNSEAMIYHDQVAENYYLPLADEIHLVPPEHWSSIDHYYSTALHEIAHSTGHPMRLDREMMNNKGTQRYAREELVAEFTSAILHNSYNLERSKEFRDNNAAYLKSWANALRKDPNVFVVAIRNAEKAAKYIEDHMLDQELKAELLASLEATNTQVETPSIESVNTIETVFEPREETLMVAEEKVGLEQVRIASLKDVDNLTTSQKFDVLNECIGIELVTANGKPIQLGEFLYPSESKGVTANEHTYQTTTKDGNEPIIYAGREFVEFFQNLTKEHFNRRMDGSDLKLSVRWYVKPLEEIHLRKPLQEYPVTLTTSPELNHKQEVKTDYLDRFKALARWYESEFDEDTLSAYVKMATDLQNEGIFAKTVDFTEMVTDDNHRLVANALLVDAMVRGRGYTELRDMPLVDMNVDGRKVRGMVKTAYKSLAEGEDLRVALSPWKSMEGYYTDEPWLFKNIRLTDIPMDKLLKDEYGFREMQQAYYFDRIHQLAQKGYVDLNAFSPTIQKEIVEAKQYTEEIIKKYNEFNAGKRLDQLEHNPSLSKALAIKTENELISKMIDSLPQQQVMNMVSEVQAPKIFRLSSIEDVKTLSTEEKMRVLEAGVGISIYGTELAKSENNIVNIGGGNDAFGPAISKLAGGRDYEVSKDDKEPIIYTGKTLNELVTDLGKEDVIDSQFGGFGYAKTYFNYYMKPLKDISDFTKPMKDYEVDHDVRHDMGDGDFAPNENHIISYLEEVASDTSNPLSNDAKIYLAIAKDLEKEQILTKPSFENNTDMLYKAMAISALRAYPDFDNHIGHMVKDFDMPEHNFLEAFKSDKTPVEILREFNQKTMVDVEPNLNTNIITTPFDRLVSGEDYHKSLEKPLQLESLGKLIEKGYADKSLFTESTLDAIAAAHDISDKIVKRFTEYYIHEGYGGQSFVDNPSLRYRVARESEPLFETMPYAKEREQQISFLKMPHSVEEAHALTIEEKKAIFERALGVRIEFMEGVSSTIPDPLDSTKELSGSYLGGGTTVFGNTVSEAAGGHFYAIDYSEAQRHVLYTGKELNQLINDLQKEDIIRNQFGVGGYTKTYLEYYLRPINELNSDKPLDEYLVVTDSREFSRTTLRYDMGDGDFHQSHNVIDYLDYLASKESLPIHKDAEIYLAIAKDLEQEQILTKPSFENNTEVLFKAMTIAALQNEESMGGRNRWDVAKELESSIIELQSSKSVMEIIKDNHLPTVLNNPTMEYTEILAAPPPQYRINSGLHEAIIDATHLVQANDLMNKGYFKLEDLPKELQSDIVNAPKIVSKLNEYYRASQKNEDKVYDNHRYTAKQSAQFMFDTIPNATISHEREDALKPPDIKLGLKHMVTPEIKTLDDIDTLTLRQKVNVLRKGVGVEIAYTESSALNHESYHNQLDYKLGGGTIVFGKELGEHTGGHSYSIDMKTPIVYRGEQANQLLNDLSNEDTLQQMICDGCVETKLNYYITPVAQLNDRVTSLDDPKRLLYQEVQTMGEGIDYTRDRSNLGLALEKASHQQPDNFDLQVYAKIAKDLEKEAILEKPRLPLDNPMFVKSVALAVSRQEIDADNAIGWAVREHPNVVDEVEKFEDPTKILESIKIPSLASGYKPLNNELLDHTPKEIGYPIDHVNETLKQAGQQKLAEVLVKKGYIPEHSLHDDAFKGLEGAEYFSDRLYSKYQKHVKGNQDALDSGFTLENKHYLMGNYLASEFKKVTTIDLRREQERQASLSAAPVATILSREAYTYTLPDEAFKEKSKDLPQGTSYGLYDPPYVPPIKSKEKDKVEIQETQKTNSRRERRQMEAKR